ncbi:MAG: hypothetical protein AB1351_05720 [Thermoproteota archaeon]
MNMRKTRNVYQLHIRACLSILGILLILNNTIIAPARAQDSFDLQKAKSYIGLQYNASLGLVRENEQIERYWLWSDNELAARVLADYDTDLSANITNSISVYREKYLVEFRTAYGILLDKDASFLSPLNKNIFGNVWYTDFAGTDELQCSDYADIAFLKAIYYQKIGNYTASLQCQVAGEMMFDGVGFRDKAFHSDGNRYSTYKIALWKIAHDFVRAGDEDIDVILYRILKKMQDSDTGGVYTHYTQDLIPDSQTNVETTALAIMAATSQPSSHPNPAQGIRERGFTGQTRPVLKDMSGNELSAARVGQLTMISTTAVNSHIYDLPFVAIIEVRDEDGVTVYLEWQKGTLDPNSRAEIGISWIPERAGEYEIRTFLVSHLAEPQILTMVSTTEIQASLQDH